MNDSCHCMKEEPCAAKIAIFRHLDEESLWKISNIAVHREYPKGTVLFSPEHSTGLFLIAEGKVKVYEISPSGKEQLLRVLNKGDFVGEEALFSNKETYTFGEALTDLKACFIRREDFLELLTQYPSISLKLLEAFSSRMIHSGHQATENMAESVLTRVVSYLLDLSSAQESNCVRLPLPMKELAAFLNTTPETLSRRVKYLQDEGMICKSGHTIILQDMDRLREIML